MQTAVLMVLGLAGRLSLPWLLVTEAVLLAAGLLVRFHGQPGAPARIRIATGEAALLAGIAALGLGLFWVLCAYPTNEWDTLAYHLPAVAQWYQTGHLARLPHDSMQTACYPYGWELLCSLFVFPLHRDSLALVPNLLAWALLGAAVFGLAREWGAARWAALSGAAVVLSLPGVVDNINSLHIDLAMGAFLTAAAYFAAVYARTRGRGEVYACLGAVALACGTKSSALLYLPPLVLALLLGPRFRHVEPDARPQGWRNVLALAGVAVMWALTGFWYVRNLVELGNPLAPVAVHLGSRVLFAGYIEPSALRPCTLFYMLTDGAAWRLLGRAFLASGGWPFVGLALLSLIGLPFLVRARRPWAGPLLWVAVTGLLYALTPFSGDSGAHHGHMTVDYVASQMRIGYPFFAAVAVLAGVGMTALPLPGAVFVVGAGGSLLGAMMGLRLAPLALLAVIGVVVYRRAARREHPAAGTRRWIVVVALVAGLLLVTYAARGRREAHGRAIYGPVSAYLGQQVPPRGKVGYLLCAQNYLLYGPDLRRGVVYVPLRSPDPAAWRTFLREHPLDLVALGPDKGTFTAEQRSLVEWLGSPAGPLVKVFAPGPEQMTLYRVKPEWVRPASGGAG